MILPNGVRQVFTNVQATDISIFGVEREMNIFLDPKSWSLKLWMCNCLGWLRSLMLSYKLKS